MMNDATRSRLLALCRFGLIAALIDPFPAAGLQRGCPWDPVALLHDEATCGLPIDDTKKATSESPWTHDPLCLKLKTQGFGEKVCVYSSSTFNQNNGISIIATPDTAASLADAVLNPADTWEARTHLSVAESERQASVAYELKPVPGKGSGVVATRAIKRYEIIMIGFPALIFDDVFFPLPQNGTPPVEGPRLFHPAVEQLGDPERLWALSAGDKGGDPVHDIIMTNAFGATFNGRGHKVLYPEIARINHACDPNAVARSFPNTLAMKVIATRDIGVGEEISLSYIPLGLPSAHRTMALAQQWGFHCACDMCLSSREEKQASDARRERLVQVQVLLRHEDTAYEALSGLANELVDLARAEGMTTKLSDFAFTVATAYFKRGDLATTEKYADVALRYLMAFGDPDSQLVADLQKNIEWLRGLRAKQAQNPEGG